VEAGEIGKAAFEAELFDADPVIDQEFAGVADADLCHELGVGLAGPRFEIAAERVGYQAGDGSYLIEIDLLGKVAEGIVVDGVYTVVFGFRKIGPKADGRKKVKLVGAGEDRKAFDQGGDPADTFGKSDLFYSCGYLFFPSADEDAAPGFFQQIVDGLCLR